MAFELPRMPFGGFSAASPDQQQIWWQQFADRIEAAIDDIANMFDDDVLTPVEKPNWMLMYSVLIGEQSGLDAEATSYGITTEKTDYDTAITDLTTYLATLTVPVAWNDTSGNTDIVGPDFRTYFTDVLTAKQALANAISAAGKDLADAAAREAARIASYPNPGVGILHATESGGSVTITIDNHTRVYPVQGAIDVPDVAITGDTLTGQPVSSRVFIYYDDTTLADTTPTFLSTTTSATAQVGAAAGRHFVGYIDTPATGSGGSSSGGGGAPPGGGGGGGGGAIP